MKLENFKYALLDEGVTPAEIEREDWKAIEYSIMTEGDVFWALGNFNWEETVNDRSFWSRLRNIFRGTGIDDIRIEEWRNT